MAKRNSGFSLLESILYCLLFAFLSKLTLDYAGGVIGNARRNQEVVESMALMSALQKMRQDISKALPDLKYWNKDSHEMIMRQESEDVGWVLKGVKLYRMVGTYSVDRKIWKKASRSLVATGIEIFRLAYEHADHTMIRVEVTVANKVSCMQGVCTLMNGGISL